MAVTLGADVLSQYRRFSLYNSPYDAHDAGCAIDLYPEDQTAAPSPVAGEVLDTRTVSAPPKPYAVEHDYLILVDTGEYVARALHVKPGVEPGEYVERGDSLGELVRSGFFAPWVDNHVHLGFRDPDGNHLRASGSLPVDVDVPLEPLAWDGSGTVVETGETYAVLDSPAHPNPGARWVGVANDGGGLLDGGLCHYDGGGLLGGGNEASPSLLGTPLGSVGPDGRTVSWDDLTVRANGRAITGLSLFLARDDAFGVKLVCPDADFPVGTDVTVEIARR
ncbi:hypothetical protein QA599_03870 [Haloarculaceae archaeon H-GB1-1]|nr:hypothetical protein [Haloarculaceae archaeon H-GB1-1]